jgi:hypothetical protein
MPFITSGKRRSGRLLGGLVGLALLALAPAAQADTTSLAAAVNPMRCVPEPALTQPFTQWDDFAHYTLAPGGDFEDGRSGWLLLGGARIVDGNEPFQVGGPEDRSSLSLPGSSTAISAPICIDDTYPTFRFFARNTGNLRSTLKVDVLYLTAAGRLSVRASGEYTAPSSDWAPPRAMNIDLTIDPSSHAGAAPVAFRFTPGGGGNWQIDDVYVDPMARG